MAKKKQKDLEPIEELPYTAEDIAENIDKISKAMDSLSNGRLKHDTIVILISHATKLAQRDVRYVLDTLHNLKDLYLKVEDN